MKRIFLAIAVLCYAGAVYGQDGGRIHRSEFVPFDTREDADALNRKNTDKYLVFAPGLLNDGEEVLGIGNVVNLPNGWFDSFIYLHLENTGTAYTLRVNDRTVAVVEDPFAPADFDLTPYVKQGDNLILLELHESNTPELQKGFTPTPVKPFTNSYLFAQEKRSIRDFNVALIPDSTRKFGVLDLEVIVQNGYNYEDAVIIGCVTKIRRDTIGLSCWLVAQRQAARFQRKRHNRSRTLARHGTLLALHLSHLRK